MTQDFRYELIDGFAFTPWRLFIIAGNILTFFAYVALIFLPEGPKYMMATGMPDVTLETLRKIFVFNTGRSSEVTFCVLKLTIKTFLRSSEILGIYSEIYHRGSRCFIRCIQFEEGSQCQ